jgi:hypothetical protein
LWAVPVLPATRYPGTCARGAVPVAATASSIMRVTSRAVFGVKSGLPMGCESVRSSDSGSSRPSLVNTV